MRTIATLFEYVTYPYERADGDSFIDGKFFLSQKTLAALDKLNKEYQFLDIGYNTIKPLNYVGVIWIGDLSIQIFPKLFKGDNYSLYKDLISGNLLKMLSLTESLTIKEIESADLEKRRDYDLFEIFMHLFAKNLAHVLKNTHNRSYVAKSSELKYIRGKINVKKYTNQARLHIIPCDFYDFSSNNLLNQTLKYTCYLMSRTARDFSTIRFLKTNIDLLEQVELTPVKIEEIDRIVFTRLTKPFEPFIRICRIFLAHSTFTLQASKIESFSLILPMEKLFEEFIAEMLRRDQQFYFGHSLAVHPQKQIGKIAHTDDGREIFALKPDIVLNYPEISAIIDTKYKILKPEDSKLGVSQSDVYQMYAYASKSTAKSCMLLYPDTIVDRANTFLLSVPSPDGENREVPLYICSICLAHDLLSSDGWQLFKEELAAIVSRLIPEATPLQSAPSIPS